MIIYKQNNIIATPTWMDKFEDSIDVIGKVSYARVSLPHFFAHCFKLLGHS